jgi:hypothetical protein
VKKNNAHENRKNAYIAMERFKIQSYNWDKTTAELMEIYDVGQTFITKMRKEVGYLSPKERLDQAKKKFAKTKKDHTLTVPEIVKKYEVTRTAAEHMLAKVTPSKHKLLTQELDRKICSHPDFGIPGERAPVSQRKIATELGVCCDSIAKRRKAKGVLPFKQIHTGPRPVPTALDKIAYKVCRLTHGWGRPKGIDKHLEELRERQRAC